MGLEIRNVVLENGVVMKGLYATRDFKPGEVIFTLEWEQRQHDGHRNGHGGKLVPFRDSYSPECWDRGIPVGPNAVFCPDPSNPLYWYNHNCEPNSAMTQFGPIHSNPFTGKRYLKFRAIKPIKNGDHITIDYASFSSMNCGDNPGEPYRLECACGSPNCRGKKGGVTSFGTEKPDVQERLILSGQAVLAFLVDEAMEKMSDPFLANLLWSLVAADPRRHDLYRRALRGQQAAGRW